MSQEPGLLGTAAARRPAPPSTILLVGCAVAVASVGCGPLPGEDEPAPATPATVAAAPQPDEATVQVDPAADVYADTDPSALTDFHATLDAHGSWVEDPTYGTVWVPNPAEVGPGFAPYETAGHWAYDDTDYVWYSDYDWGWAPFHYGRWMYGGAGWVWIPGRVYSPAWVTWRMGAPGYAYVGWAPMAAGFYWRGGVAFQTSPMVVAPGGFYYCGHGDVFAANLSGHVVASAQVGGIAAHTQAYGGGGGFGAGAHGPAPSSMGLPPSSVTHANPNDKGQAMARNFAHPSTAAAMGAHPPSKHKVGAAPAKGRGGSRGGSRGGGAHGGGHGGHR